METKRELAANFALPITFRSRIFTRGLENRPNLLESFKKLWSHIAPTHWWEFDNEISPPLSLLSSQNMNFAGFQLTAKAFRMYEKKTKKK